MRIERLQEKLPEAIIDWYVKKGLQAAIRNVGSLREGLTLVVRLDKAIHTWHYVEADQMTAGRIKPLANWQLAIVSKGTSSQGALLLSASAERRLVPRAPGIIMGELAIEVGGATFPATACDISTKGAGLLTQHQVGIATIVTIKCGADSHDLTPPLTAEVRRATPLPKGEWVIGCAFSRTLGAVDLLELSKGR